MVERDRLAAVASIDGVAAVVPVLSRQMAFTTAGADTSVRLLALDVPPGVSFPEDVQDRYVPRAGSIVLDRLLSRKTGLGENDSLAIGGIPLTVAGVTSGAGEAFIQFAFVNFLDAARIFGVEGVVNYGIVVLAPGANREAIATEVEQRDRGLAVFTDREFARSVRKEIDESFLPVIAILLGIGFIVGAAVVGLTIYTATIERSREFGVMKAVGGSPGFLYRIVLSQSTMLTGAGFAVGLVAALIVARLASQVVPEFVTVFEPLDVAAVLGAAIVMAVVASFVPVSRINRIDPAAVFRA